MPRTPRAVLAWLAAAAAAGCFAAYCAARAGPPPGPGPWAAARDYGATLTAVLAALAVGLAFGPQLVPPPGEDNPPAGADDPALRRYRVRGGLALAAGAGLAALGGLDVLLRPADDALRPNSLLGVLGLALLAIGSVYRYDLPDIYRRVADLEDRLQRRIDTLTAGHNGNVGNGWPGHRPDDQGGEDDGDGGGPPGRSGGGSAS